MPSGRAWARRENGNVMYTGVATPDGLLTTPPDSPKILIHTRQGKCVGICCDQPAKVLVVETQDDPGRTVDPSCRAMLAMIRPQTSTELVGG